MVIETAFAPPIANSNVMLVIRVFHILNPIKAATTTPRAKATVGSSTKILLR